jgi:hypothetical protein
MGGFDLMSFLMGQTGAQARPAAYGAGQNAYVDVQTPEMAPALSPAVAPMTPDTNMPLVNPKP